MPCPLVDNADMSIGTTAVGNDAISCSPREDLKMVVARLKLAPVPDGDNAMNEEECHQDYRSGEQLALMLFEQALRDTELTPPLDKDVLDMMNLLGARLRRQERHGEALQWHMKALGYIRMASSPSRETRDVELKVLETDRHVATLLAYHRGHDWAKEELERVLARQEALGERVIEMLETRYALAMVLFEASSWPEALQAFEMVQRTRLQEYGECHPATLEAGHRVGMVLVRMGRHKDALNKQMEILTLRTKALGKSHPSTLDTMDGIANIYELLGRYDEALSLYRHVLDKLANNSALIASSWVLSVKSGVADIHMRQARYDVALEIYSEVHEGLSNLDWTSDQTCLTLSNIGRANRDMGYYTSALGNFERAILERGTKHGEGDVALLVAKSGKASVLELQGRYNEALQLHEEILRIDLNALDHDNIEIFRTVYYMGSIAAKQGRYRHALRLFDHIMNNLKPGDRSHQVALVTARTKADVLEQLGRCRKALKVYSYFLKEWEREHTRSHPEYYFARYGIARVYAQQGKYERALRSFKAAVNGWSTILRPDHPFVFMGLEGQGSVRLQQGHLIEACKLYKQALRGYRAALGDQHPWPLRTSRVFPGIVFRLVVRLFAVPVGFLCSWHLLR